MPCAILCSRQIKIKAPRVGAFTLSRNNRLDASGFVQHPAPQPDPVTFASDQPMGLEKKVPYENAGQEKK